MKLKSRSSLTLVSGLAGALFLGQGGYIHAKAWLAQYLLEQAWEQTVQTGVPTRPWPWADTWPVSRLQAPQYGVDLIILNGDSGRSLAFGPGHNTASALPGTPGNSIISAHRDTHFSFLRKLKQGDQLVITSPGHRQQRLTVESTQVIDQDQAYFLEQHSVARLYLVTCYPFDAIQPGGNLRYIVSAEPVLATEDIYTGTGGEQ